MRKVLAAVILAVCALAGAGQASATTTTVAAATAGNLTSPRWSGYYATGTKRAPVQMVTTTFSVPKVSCSRGWYRYPRTVAMWAGIGGIGNIDRKNVRLEQAGLFIYCKSAKSRPYYAPFWEVAPDKNVQLWYDSHGNPITVSPGQQVQVFVGAPGMDPVHHPGQWEFEIYVGSNPALTAWYKLPAGEKPGTTAEVITEWTVVPTACYPVIGCLAHGGLAYAGSVLYTDAEFATGSSPAAATWRAVTEHTMTMYNQGVKVLYPGPAGPVPGDQPNDNLFSTHYTGKW
jgi:hypothetical protein